jgi:hypothetical protein
VLVLVPGQVVLAVHVSPVNDSWVFLKNVPSMGNSLQFTSWEFSIWNATVVLLFEFEEEVFFGCWNLILASCGIVNRLGEWIDSRVIS